MEELHPNARIVNPSGNIPDNLLAIAALSGVGRELNTRDSLQALRLPYPGNSCHAILLVPTSKSLNVAPA